MFSIYCVSTLSLSDNECRVIFSSAREDLLARYRFGCQQALLNCEVFKTEDRDCLTALLLYLVSLSNYYLSYLPLTVPDLGKI